MEFTEKSHEQLISEIETLRRKVETLEASSAISLRIEEALRAQEEDARQLSERLGAMVTVANDLSMCKDLDDLCCRAVERGQSRLGFERVGIWFRASEEDEIRGSYGTDRCGKVCDERGLSHRIEPDLPEGRIIMKREPVVVNENAPVKDTEGHVLSHAPQAYAGVYDGEAVIGHVSIDNHMSRAPITPGQLEVLRLYASAIGYLYTRKRIEMENAKLIEDLRAALERIEALNGLLPICCNCKKIRDDKGYWNQLEQYIEEHSRAEFSHGICPECIKKLYPDLYEQSMARVAQKRAQKAFEARAAAIAGDQDDECEE